MLRRSSEKLVTWGRMRQSKRSGTAIFRLRPRFAALIEGARWGHTIGTTCFPAAFRRGRAGLWVRQGRPCLSDPHHGLLIRDISSRARSLRAGSLGRPWGFQLRAPESTVLGRPQHTPTTFHPDGQTPASSMQSYKSHKTCVHLCRATFLRPRSELRQRQILAATQLAGPLRVRIEGSEQWAIGHLQTHPRNLLQPRPTEGHR